MIFSGAVVKLSVGARNTLSRSLLALALLALTACSSTPTTHFYVLSGMSHVQSASPQNAKQVSVVIREVRLPQYLERPQIITRGGDNRIQLADDAQWAGNLQQDMTRVLTENLGQLLNSELVFSAPHNGPIKPDFRVDVEILRFEQGVDGRVTLSARWWLIRGGDNALVEAPSITLNGSAIGERSRDALVASMSKLYGELAQLIAHSINKNSVAVK
ncbi:MAG: membrane integrity-associated transporter subunit PqiC [Rhodocyclaceae bacterium]|nr:membrane integrity-associated transporter subunit PqiC [Rhodocyclaceae bacterium]MBL0077409.1 membrane integrity-associated transporter subunit PqiC [Rhodocyclaceae bacterium]MBP6108805.1 membrane integrity-associated transporter subunit PqiC [Rhodocyclaceae bacterium]MBP6278991.1 membrane integrity-associated transporter subunit PqiC [Rhodocyclaceae bacterium]